MIAFQKNKNGFSQRWINYCEINKIQYKLVDFYDNNIIEHLRECSVVMWHFSHFNYKDMLMARQLLYSLQLSGIKVFPDFKTAWHFDDKVGQKYLLEAMGAPLVPSYVFYSKKDAISWISMTTFPKVFKLRGGAGASNVKLVKSKGQAKNLVISAFNKGFKYYDPIVYFKDSFGKFKNGKANFIDLLKSFIRLFRLPEFARMYSREKGYIYFQKYIPNLDCDYRLITIDRKILGIKRYTRDNDFRASGSGKLAYDPILFPIEMLKLANQLAEKLKLQSAAFDFVIDNGEIKLIEVSYGFPAGNFADDCPGYWNEDLRWQEGKFNPYGWMVESMIN